MFQKFVIFFFPKRIVWSTCYPKGILLKATDISGKKYITIAVTNIAVNGEGNQALIYHVPEKKVIGIQRTITPFERWFYANILNRKAPTYHIKPLKK